jgi:hypothetical protein
MLLSVPEFPMYSGIHTARELRCGGFSTHLIRVQVLSLPISKSSREPELGTPQKVRYCHIEKVLGVRA